MKKQEEVTWLGTRKNNLLVHCCNLNHIHRQKLKKITFVGMPNTYMLQTVTLIFNTVCYPAQCSSVETKGSRLPLGYYKNKATTSALLLINPIHTRSTRETKLVRKTKHVCETDQRHVLVAYRVVTGAHNGLLVVIISTIFIESIYSGFPETLV